MRNEISRSEESRYDRTSINSISIQIATVRNNRISVPWELGTRILIAFSITLLKVFQNSSMEISMTRKLDFNGKGQKTHRFCMVSSHNFYGMSNTMLRYV